MSGRSAPLRLRMIHPLENLRADHELVARAASALVAIGEAVGRGAPFPAADAALAIRFLREFLLGVHLHKEATWLWPPIAMRGDDDAAATVGELARMHEEISELIHSLMLFWEPGDLSAPERAGFASTCQALHDRLDRMVEVEEGTLFTACSALVPPDDLLDWVEHFQGLEQERGSAAIWTVDLSALLQRWAH